MAVRVDSYSKPPVLAPTSEKTTSQFLIDHWFLMARQGFKMDKMKPQSFCRLVFTKITHQPSNSIDKGFEARCINEIQAYLDHLRIIQCGKCI